MQKYDELFGKDYNMAFKKNLHLIDTVTPGVADVSSVTGCLQPCDSYQYPTHVYLSYGIRFANDLMTKQILESTGSNSSSLIVIDYIQKGWVIRQGIFPSSKNDPNYRHLKFTFSEKATKIYKIFTINLTVCTSNRQINGEGFVIFCGLLREHELYKCFNEV